MKASEVLKRYALGERNFQRVNLRGQSFKEQNLSGADFSEADLCSTNFSGANLKRVNFSGAKCGLQKRWALLIVILSWLLASISAMFSLMISTGLFEASNLGNHIVNWVVLPALTTFFAVTIRHGVLLGLVAGVFLGIVFGTGAGIVLGVERNIFFGVLFGVVIFGILLTLSVGGLALAEAVSRAAVGKKVLIVTRVLVVFTMFAAFSISLSVSSVLIFPALLNYGMNR